MTNVPLIIGFDEAHKPRGRINSNYRQLVELLNQNGFICQSYESYPIMPNTLSEMDILVFVCPDFSRVEKNEIDAIKIWVKEEGGSLLLLSHAGGDKGRRSNLSELGQQFGVIFENDQCLDEYNNLGVENLPIINAFGFPHPINEELKEICYRAGCTLSVAGTNTTPVISSGTNSDPSETPIVLAAEVGEGRIIGIGSYEMFRDNTNGGIDYGSHKTLAVNVFSWLRSSKREALRSGTAQPQIEQSPTQTDTNTSISNNNSANNNRSTIPIVNYNSNVKMVASRDLLKAFEDQLAALYDFKERMMNEFEILQKNTENLIRAVIASEEDIIRFKAQGKFSEEEVKEIEEKMPEETPAELSSLMANLDQIQKQQANETVAKKSVEKNSNSFNLSPPPGVSQPEQTSNSDIAPSGQDLPQLTPLPSKTGGYQENYVASNEDNLGGTLDYSQSYQNEQYSEESYSEQYDDGNNYENSEEIVQETEEPPVISKTLEKSEDELKQEIEGIEKKLNSIRNLRSFVEKKYESGKITKAKYDKQIKKLENDKNKGQFRMDEIKDILK